MAGVLPQVAATSLGLDFNPMTDQLRGFVLGSEGIRRENVRGNPDTGLPTFDTRLRYPPGKLIFLNYAALGNHPYRRDFSR